MTQPRDTGGLGLGRGVLYSVQGQDLLQYVGNVDVNEQKRLDAMHGSLFDLLRQSGNQGMGSMVYPYPDGARYNNITAHLLASLLATARLLDDAGKVNAVLYGDDPAAPLLPSWTRSFDRLIYGEADRLPESGENPSPTASLACNMQAIFKCRTLRQAKSPTAVATPLRGRASAIR